MIFNTHFIRIQSIPQQQSSRPQAPKMGNNNPQSRKNYKTAQNSLLVGFQNKSLTICYANSVLQVLFHHPIFINIILNTECKSDGLISQLRGLYKMTEDKKEKSAISNLKVMAYIEKTSGIFQREHHQDSHQFYIWLMNQINDELKAINKKNGRSNKQPTKLEQEFFSKRITKTQCLQCHTISERQEEEVDLSLVLPEPNVSLNYCVENYSAVEKLTGKNKFKCDKCGDLQNADKRTLIKTLPNFLSVHLRRFKYDQVRKGIIKLMWLIPFPYKIKIRANYTPTNPQQQSQQNQQQNKQIMYRLVGVVAHIGSGGNFGHYVCYIKIGKQWYIFNDEEIQEIDDYMLQSLWGYKGMNKCAYMLFYSL